MPGGEGRPIPSAYVAGGIPRAVAANPLSGALGYEGAPGPEVAGGGGGAMAALQVEQKRESGATGTPQRGQFMSTSRGQKTGQGLSGEEVCSLPGVQLGSPRLHLNPRPAGSYNPVISSW
jgi:hypothetical protein